MIRLSRTTVSMSVDDDFCFLLLGFYAVSIVFECRMDIVDDDNGGVVSSSHFDAQNGFHIDDEPNDRDRCLELKNMS